MRFEHLNLTVRDLSASLRFVGAAFPTFRPRGEGRGNYGRWMHFGDDDHYIALTEAWHPETPLRRPYSGTLGIDHLGVEVCDIDGLTQRMADCGFTPNLRADEHPARRRVYFFDPDGNDWEFVQYNSDDPAERNDYSI